MNPSEKAEKFMNMLKGDEPLAYDVETGGPEPGDGAPLDWKRGYVCGYSLSDGVTSVYVPVRHGSDNLLAGALFESDIAKTVAARKEPLIGHNIKFDAHFSFNHGISLGDKVVDTMVDAALLNENKFSYSLENTCKEYDIPQKKGKELYAHIASQYPGVPNKPDAMGHFYRLSGSDAIACDYAETDTLATWHLHDIQKDKIEKEGLDVVANLERKLNYVLFKMERRGVKIDLGQIEEITKKIKQLHYDAFLNIPLKEDYTPINVRSGKDLKEYFDTYEIFDYPMTEPTDRHPDGQPSFKKDFLKTNDLGKLILEARKYATFTSMFLEPFPKHIHNGKIHARFNQAVGEFGGARPGRLSCGDPNMQFIPKRDALLGGIFRKAFIPSDEKYTYIEFDYNQAEPCLFTHYSSEPSLMEGYNATPRIDMHSIAARFMNIDRQTAKSLNLGMMYAMGAKKLAIQLGISYEEARYIIGRWHRTFPRVSHFTKRASEVAEEREYVHTILGRRARFTNPNYSYRAANRIVQGGSADILKYKMVEIEENICADGLQDQIRMLVTIHDSILFEVETENLQCDPFNLRVPITTEYKYGANWAEATYGKAA